MEVLRRLVFGNRPLAFSVIALALLLRAIIPAGFMPVAENGEFTVELCSGHGPQQLTLVIPGRPHSKHDQNALGDKDLPCGFSSLAFQLLAAADVMLLASAIVFIMATVRRFTLSRAPRPFCFLRPPLRAPPTTISLVI